MVESAIVATTLDGMGDLFQALILSLLILQLFHFLLQVKNMGIFYLHFSEMKKSRIFNN
jgi:hypothetical protein